MIKIEDEESLKKAAPEIFGERKEALEEEQRSREKLENAKEALFERLEADGLKLNINSDADVQVINSLKKEMEAQLAGIKDNIKAELTKKINEASGGALSQFGSLDDIKGKLTGSVNKANEYDRLLLN